MGDHVWGAAKGEKGVWIGNVNILIPHPQDRDIFSKEKNTNKHDATSFVFFSSQMRIINSTFASVLSGAQQSLSLAPSLSFLRMSSGSLSDQTQLMSDQLILRDRWAKKPNKRLRVKRERSLGSQASSQIDSQMKSEFVSHLRWNKFDLRWRCSLHSDSDERPNPPSCQGNDVFRLRTPQQWCLLLD